MTQEEKYFQKSLDLTFFFLAISLLFLLFFWQKLPPQIPLFYSLPWGIEQLGSPTDLFLFPVSILTAIALILVIKKFISKEQLLILIVSFTGVLFSFMACFSLIKIILLVI